MTAATGTTNPTIGRYPVNGWLYFAGTIMGIAGIMRVVDAIWAFRYRGSLPEDLHDGLLGSNLKTYGWVWLGVGVLLIISSFMVLTRSQFARWIGMISAVVLGLSGITWMPYYPIWSLVYVALSAMTLYGLSAYGGQLSTDAGRSGI